MTNTIKIGIMPGRLQELAVESTTTLAEALQIADLNADGYEVKVDGTKVTDFNTNISNARVVLLAKQVKGNAGTVKVGIMPGRLNEFAVEEGTSIADLLALAELNADGYEVKVDGTKVTDFNQAVGNARVVLLAKQVKGNSSTVKVGVMPGRLNEFAVESNTTIADLLALAELNADGYEVKVDGTKVTDFNQPVGIARVVLLAKQVKGN